MSILFEPKNIGNLTLKNRFIRSSTAESMAGPNGEITPPMLEFYEALARGGAGCIFLGHGYVHNQGRSHPRMTGLHDDSLLAGLRGLADVIHGHDCKVFAQLNYAGSRVQEGYVEPVGPSAVANPFFDVTVRELRRQEIEEIIEAFGRAAARVREAGLDGVLIHGGHGYLVSFFLSPLTNLREDEWGGDLAGRARFLEEVYGAIRKAVGPDYPVAVKLGIKDDPEGGLTIEEGAEVAGRLAAKGMDAIEISGGLPSKEANALRKDILKRKQEAYFLPYAKAVRAKVGEMPLSLVGGLRSPEVMEEIINAGWTDYISMARPFICEPDLVLKISEGRGTSVSCTSCLACRAGFAKEGLRCRRDE
ncbi:MAG: NADH:flavin oxidoreductase [Deltaproteobacteria bacterium]|nr:NADH:flavin oxidoreductase [Deltaproteobacteria bacterium]